MGSTMTVKNHYNPCFWTAYWNPTYYAAQINNTEILKARDQGIYILNIKANKILGSKVEKVHFEKDLATAELKPDEIIKFVEQFYPSSYDKISRYVNDNPETLILDSENIFTAIEDSPAYKALISVIKKEAITSGEEKQLIACFVAYHWLRSLPVMYNFFKRAKNIGLNKFSFFIILRQILRDQSLVNVLIVRIMSLLTRKWNLYKSKDFILPLSDSAILAGKKGILIPLSPKLLLEIRYYNKSIKKQLCSEISEIPESKLEEYRKVAIACTLREIIFHDEQTLIKWQNSDEYKMQHKKISDNDLCEKLITKLSTIPFFDR